MSLPSPHTIRPSKNAPHGPRRVGEGSSVSNGALRNSHRAPERLHRLALDISSHVSAEAYRCLHEPVALSQSLYVDPFSHVRQLRLREAT